MTNKVTVNTIPVIVPEKHQNPPNWEFKENLAKQDLELAQKSILRHLEQNIPIKFSVNVILTLLINLTTLKIKIDYYLIKSKTRVSLIKLHPSIDIDGFAKNG